MFEELPIAAERYRMPTRRGVLMVLGTATLASFILPHRSLAQSADASAASAPVAALNSGLLAAMKAGKSLAYASRYAQLLAIVQQSFDMPVVLRRTIGALWTSLSDAERAGAMAAFERYTVASYLANFNHFGGERFDILPDTRSVGEAMIVSTRIVPSAGTPARLDYVVHTGSADAAQWRIVDILLDGSISQVAVQHSEFNGVLAAGGITQLITVLDRKAVALSSGS